MNLSFPNMTDLNLPERRVFIGPARLWKRAFSFLLDLAILDFFVYSFFTELSQTIVGSSTDMMGVYQMLMADTGKASAIFMILTIIIMLTLAYFVLLQYAIGQTVGEMLLDLHVVIQTDDKELTTPTFWQCMLRNIFIIPAMPFILLWVIDPVYFFITKKNQRLTEWLSQTSVIEQYMG